MLQKVMLCRLIWAEQYDSKDEEIFAGNMRYPAAHGFAHEQLNFAPEDGNVFGFVENRGENLDVRKLGAAPSADSVDGVNVIFCAVDKLSMKLRVVGWYESATVYRTLQRPKKGSIRGSWQHYFKAASHDAHLIPATSRDLEVPRRSKVTDKGYIGQRNFFYPVGNPKYERFLQSFDLLVRDMHVDRSEQVDAEEYQEGQRAWREASYSARNQKLVRAAKRHHGTVCQACGFDFKKTYGSLGQGYIEVHHKQLIAGGRKRASTVDDVDVLCANCHRMVHRSAMPLSLADLKGVLSSATATNPK